jgi:hypothetical protein
VSRETAGEQATECHSSMHVCLAESLELHIQELSRHIFIDVGEFPILHVLVQYMRTCVLRAPHVHCDRVSPDVMDMVIASMWAAPWILFLAVLGRYSTYGASYTQRPSLVHIHPRSQRPAANFTQTRTTNKDHKAAHASAQRGGHARSTPAPRDLASPPSGEVGDGSLPVYDYVQ